MSIGIGAYAELYVHDNETVIYRYGSYNLNISLCGYENHIYNGVIIINHNCFVEPEIHEKIKKMPNGRKKLVTKRIARDVDYVQMIVDGKIMVENCSNCWEYSENGVDIMVLHILFRLFKQYQEDGKMPEHINYNI